MNPPHAFVAGARHPFGEAIMERLRADGMTLVESVEAVPAGSSLDALVLTLPSAAREAPFRDLDEDDLRAALDDQLYTLVDTVQAAVPRMSGIGGVGGAIVQLISSDYLGRWHGVHLAASAAACLAMGRSMALELMPRGIRVNTVVTGSDDAGVAATVAWLVGPDSAHVTGDTIFADRGASLRMTYASRR